MARMVTFRVLASWIPCQIEKRDLFGLFLAGLTFGAKSNGEILTF